MYSDLLNIKQLLKRLHLDPMTDFQPKWRHRWIHCTSSHNQRTTTNLKTKNNENLQEIELYGSLTTKVLKKKHSYRPVVGAETGGRTERTHGIGRLTGRSHIHVWIN